VSPEVERSRGTAAALFATGILIAAYGAMCGIGGGLFAVPILHYVFKRSLKAAVATSLCLVSASAFSATVIEAVHPDNALRWSLVAVVLSTALLGTQIGMWIARRLATRKLKLVFCVVLGAVGLKMILATSAVNGNVVVDYVPDLGAHIVAAIAGVFAGIVVPLLGVGGGLVIVPALLFGLPELGYLGARATSLAVATFTASRSVWMYAREGLVDWWSGRWFGSGAVLGAIGGVQLVHLSGAPEIGRALLGVALCFSALRFGWDWVTSGRDRESSPQA
jgi:uncharacterized membrane protein YfcA